uniref:Checkpoint protein n=1 Tax=Globisporangium ultimum (strain ATCC 200006 / CBS 805.95 / DAOM BR144) TaxID=431595 RepID=K3W8N2_GLOUD
MELRYEIAEEHLRIFVAALHCLAQVGKEVSIECEGTTTLTCRALNDAHSASGQIAFDRSFFTSVGMQYDEDDESAARKRAALRRFVPFVKCKVYAKSCCNIFRTLKHVRSVQLAFRLDDQAALAELQQQQQTTKTNEEEELDVDCVEVVWRLNCDFEIAKTHRMKVHTCQVMRAVFDREHCANRLVTRQYHLASLLGHIHHSTEVCVTCSSTHVKFESYVANTGDGKAQLHTETAVESAEFNEYVLVPSTLGVDSSEQLIFCLKEVRALLAFCKASDILEVALYFSSGGSPVLFAAESTSMAKFSVEITLSTVTTFLPAPSQTQ